MTAPVKAQAWRIPRKGLLPVTLRKDEIEVEQPCPGEVLIKVKSAAVNPVDWKLAALAPGFVQPFPRTAAIDASGTVLAVGEGVKNISAGQKVIAAVPVPDGLKTKRGTLATHVLAKAQFVGVLPDSLLNSAADADKLLSDYAGLPLVATTALSSARRAKKGDRVLVLGGTTSVGLVLLQMLKAEGISHITATASGQKVALAQERGADEVIDYRATNVVEELKKKHSAPDAQFDVVLDTVDDYDVHFACGAFLKKSGEYFKVGASGIEPDWGLFQILGYMRRLITLHFLPAFLGGVSRKSTLGQPAHDTVQEIVDKYLATQKVKPDVDSEFAFDDAPKAYERVMTGRALGKVIVKVEP